jgi:hypothetical protein
VTTRDPRVSVAWRSADGRITGYRLDFPNGYYALVDVELTDLPSFSGKVRGESVGLGNGQLAWIGVHTAHIYSPDEERECVIRWGLSGDAMVSEEAVRDADMHQAARWLIEERRRKGPPRGLGVVTLKSIRRRLDEWDGDWPPSQEAIAESLGATDRRVRQVLREAGTAYADEVRAAERRRMPN